MQLPVVPSRPTVAVSTSLRPKIPNLHDNFEWTNHLPLDTTISSLLSTLTTSTPSTHLPPTHISRPNLPHPFNPESRIPNPQQTHSLTIVSTPSSFSSHQINKSHPLLSFLHTPSSLAPVVATIIQNPNAGVGVGVNTNLLSFDDDLKLTFHRTVRMPDNGDEDGDGRIHDLPASCGGFRLWNAGEWGDRLPMEMREGVLMPMWRREAMWIAFEAGRGRSYKLRVMVGGVNAVSGGVGDEGDEEKQDYVVVPGQQWIDGVVVQPGVVRQFVAMPLGSGYTVEGQVTGKEKKGGLQIEIVPSFPHASPGVVWVVGEEGERRELELQKTPEEQGCKEGDVVYWQTPVTFREATLRDLLTAEEAQAEAEVRVLKLEAGYNPRCSDRGQAMELDEYYGFMGNYSPSYRSTSPDAVEYPPVTPNWNSPNYTPISPVDEVPDIEYAADLVMNSPIMSPASYVGNAPQGLEQGTRHRDRDRRDPVKLEPAATPSAEPMKPVNIKALGLAAGGKLRQVIKPDPHPPHIWDNARRCTVNIHILSPENFEEVTGIVAPECPITMAEYVRAGIPVYEMEEEVVGGAGTGEVLGQVKSVGGMDKMMLDMNDTAQGIAGEDTAGPRRCGRCEERLCDSVVRPCNHQFCWECITKEKRGEMLMRCLQERCRVVPIRAARFAASMNVPGKEMNEVNVPVVKLTSIGGKPMVAIA